jgi:hypothetical protein
MQTGTRFAWNEMMKKEVRGINNFSLGEVQSIGSNFVVTEKGTVSKHKYYLPKYLVKGFDGKVLWFNIPEKQAENDFKRNTPPSIEEYQRYRTPGVPSEVETYVPSV